MLMVQVSESIHVTRVNPAVGRMPQAYRAYWPYAFL